ncbi:DUF927 domain-containing protein [Actinoallomurus sp. NBC_01490]|uniref:DUF927 domain-containing protein n=1 Tax=Actinoallomurus sp. NBC_01490 TaxID=2903557 RepID=UPI002E332812|nr:DUF927 domain-containing protein [Actinoallomurus sp. NBC_01490]
MTAITTRHLQPVATTGTAPVPGPATTSTAAATRPVDAGPTPGAEAGKVVFGPGGLPVGFTTPEGYHADHGGVWALKIVTNKKTKEEEEIRIRIAWAPLVLVRVFIDPAGDQLVELAWTDRGRTITRIVPRSIAKSGKRLVGALGDAGLPVIEADARGAERWLAALEAANRDRIERVQLARWLGWQPDGTFVTGQDTPRRVEVRYDEQAPALAAHHSGGTLADWQAVIKHIECYPVAQMALYAGLAAPLLHPLGLDSFTIDFSGRSTRGKTTGAMVGLSCWADPTEKGDAISSWRTTMLAIEKRLNLVQGLPVVLDETRVVKFPELVDQVLYQVPKNHGTPRGGGWPSGLPWRTILISTGEQSALSFTTHQGAAARVLAVQSPPFGNGGHDSADAAIAVRDGLADNYGTAGPAFVARLLDGLGKPDGRERLIARHKTLTETFRGSTDMTGRRAPMVAALALAADLAHHWGIVPFPPPEIEVWMSLFIAADPTDNRPEMALDVVREYIAARSQDLWRPHSIDDQPHGGWIGRELTIDGRTTVGLLPERLKEALHRAGYELAAVVPGWREIGALVEIPSHNPPYQPIKKLAGRGVRMYILTPDALTGPTTDDEE